MSYVSYTIYPAHIDPAPGRGKKPAQVGITFAPTPCLTYTELLDLMMELNAIERQLRNA